MEVSNRQGATFAGCGLWYWVVQAVAHMSRVELLQQAYATREQASRAKRLARTLTQESDRSRLLRYAKELEDQASDLERDAGSSSSPSAA
jgi:hypothetical protein